MIGNLLSKFTCQLQQRTPGSVTLNNSLSILTLLSLPPKWIWQYLSPVVLREFGCDFKNSWSTPLKPGHLLFNHDWDLWGLKYRIGLRWQNCRICRSIPQIFIRAFLGVQPGWAWWERTKKVRSRKQPCEGAEKVSTW